MKGYGQFCPLAQAAEILAERWTPLVVRELVWGNRRFNEIHRGVPLMSSAVHLTVRTDAATMARVWLGEFDLVGAFRSRWLVVEGPSHLRRAFPDWLKMNQLAGIEQQASRV